MEPLDNGCIKISYVKNIIGDGSNIGNDIVNPSAILYSDDYSVNFSLSTTRLELSGDINNKPFSVFGTVVTTNENKNVLLYEIHNNSSDFKSVYMSVERELDETALFFKGFHQENPLFHNVIKLYLQPIGQNELIYIEIFLEYDFVADYLENNNISYDSDLANTLQSWFVSIYDPIAENNASNLAPASANATRTVDLSKTYNLNGSGVTYKFVANIFYNVPNISKNGNGTASFCFEIATSKTTSDLAANNSSTQNVLRLEDLNITVKTFPNFYTDSKDGSRSYSLSMSVK